jgi:hypothetical protein
MPTLEPIDISQSESNALSRYADIERNRLFPRNDYNTGNQYTATNPDALATGDEQGKGTGGDLDVYNNTAGNNIDNEERLAKIRINRFSSNNTYPDF